MAIWSKGGDDTDALVHAFTVGDDYLYDRVIAPFDLLGCLAHASMLRKTGLISQETGQSLISGLRQLHAEYEAGSWTVEATDEDVHSKIEALLTERLGDAGKQLHTGRSRNDQVLTAVRLWQKHALGDLVDQVCGAAEALLTLAAEQALVPLPGYTHLQRGMPSSCGQFFGAHAQALVDDLVLLEAAYHLADACPLGSGASYGVGLPLDRELCAHLLGFGRPIGIALRDANGRGKVETAMLDALSAVIGDLSRFAADMVFFTTAECGFFTLGEGITTGSSIMPQKRNPDVFELLRGRAARFLGLRTGLAATTLGLHSGYSRDLQDTKALAIDGMRLAQQGIAVVGHAVPGITPVQDRIEAALTRELYATDEAYRLVREEGMTFRDAYVQVGKNIDAVPVPDHASVITSRTHSGSTGNLGLEQIAREISQQRERWSGRATALHAAWDKLLGDPGEISNPGKALPKPRPLD